MTVDLTAWPTDFDIRFFEIPKASVHAQVIAGQVAIAPSHFKRPPQSPGVDGHTRSNATTITSYTFQPQNNPIV